MTALHASGLRNPDELNGDIDSIASIDFIGQKWPELFEVRSTYLYNKPLSEHRTLLDQQYPKASNESLVHGF